MCGIAGIITIDGLSPFDRDAIRRMAARLIHRGPDDVGIHEDRFAALAHRRLAVIDHATGRQPVYDEAGRICVALNGEIYNYRALRDALRRRGHTLTTSGDAEPIAHLYEESGTGCLDALRGMYALAIWDRGPRCGLLARDRLGVKPLYYHANERRLAFASELKALLELPDVPRAVDPASVLDYLCFGFIPSPRTIFSGVHKLPPGALLEFRDGCAAVRSYWDLRFTGYADEPEDALVEGLWSALDEAVQLRLIADVPLGAFLSGGLDSTAVVASMTDRSAAPIETRTCGFDAPGFDERESAAAIAVRLGARHGAVAIRPEHAAILDTLAWHFDEPFADASAVPLFELCRVARGDLTVALSGDGGDEVLAGYRRYRFDVNEQAIRRVLPAALRRRVLAPLGAAYPTSARLPRVLRARATLRNLSLDGAAAHAASIATMQPTEARPLLAPDVRRAAAGHDPLEAARKFYARCDAPDHLSRCQYVDIRLGLADGILTKVDRASMAHALEVRSPLLDYRFVEFAWRIPPGLRRRGPHGKWLLRRAVRDRLGADAVRPKAGFEVPIDAWLAGPLRETFMAETLDVCAPLAGWIDRSRVDALWRDLIDGRRRTGPSLWKIAMLGAWLRTFAGSGQRLAAAVEPSSGDPLVVGGNRRGSGSPIRNSECLP